MNPQSMGERLGERYAWGGLRTVRRSVVPSSFKTSSVVSRVQMRLRRLERLISTSVLGFSNYAFIICAQHIAAREQVLQGPGPEPR